MLSFTYYPADKSSWASVATMCVYMIYIYHIQHIIFVDTFILLSYDVILMSYDVVCKYDCTCYMYHIHTLFSFNMSQPDWSIPVHLPKVQWVSGATESRPWRLTTTGGAVRLDLGISRLVRFGTAIYTRWWFQTFLMFTPIWGRWTHFDSYF